MKKYFFIPALSLCLNLFAVEHQNPAPKVGEIVWNELATSNMREAKDFYGKVFGWEFIEVKDLKSDSKMGDMTYTMIKKGNKEFGGIWEIPKNQQDQIISHWTAYILVDNVEQSLEKARKNGATIIKPVQQVGDMGHFGIIKDPTGAHIALWQPIKK